MIVAGHVRQDRFLVRPGRVDVFGVQQPRDAKFPVGHFEGVVEVLDVPARHETIVVEQIRPVRVDERVEAQPRSPRVCEVGNVHMLVALGLALAPQQKGVFGGFLLG